MSLTTQDLVDQVRDQADESNTTLVTDAYILKILNSAQRKSTNITSRRSRELMLYYHEFTTVAGTTDYDMPSDIFARKIASIEAVYNGVNYPVGNIGIKSSSLYRNTSTSASIPQHYMLFGTSIKLMPTPKSGTTVRVWYAKKPDKYVLPQGRIQEPFSTSNAYVYVDSVGSDLTTTGTSLNSYVSIVDWQSGEIKGNMQLTELDSTTGKVTFKASSLSRTTVLDKTISTSLPSNAAVDDYLCSTQGTCIPQLPEAYIDYQIQYAVIEIKKRFGEPAQEDFMLLKELKEELKKMWTGRDRRIRVQKTNSNLGSAAGGLRRFVIQ